ncbi:MAG: transglutaminase-like cysteine peptidase [Desulfobulbaceae bacterium]|nr:transglutaminase-like cysteine peptidase [Desulfobulbaceae bacterium]
MQEPTARDRWQALIRENRFASMDQKLKAVNAFFNGFDFVEDRYLWGSDDYWATLSETLGKNAGDCEDFTIAKYFTLRELNISHEDMRLTYVISVKTKEPHMVLTLRVDSSRELIVLDSQNNALLPVSRRHDLVPVFSFNTEGYWLARYDEGWSGERIGSAGKLSLWHNVLQRMGDGQSVISDG